MGRNSGGGGRGGSGGGSSFNPNEFTGVSRRELNNQFQALAAERSSLVSQRNLAQARGDTATVRRIQSQLRQNERALSRNENAARAMIIGDAMAQGLFGTRPRR